jgi:hypothetical protein
LPATVHPWPLPTAIAHVIMCIIHGGRSSAERGRRVQNSAFWDCNEFCLNKQIAERRMRFILSLRRQDNFGVTGDFDRADRSND